MHFIILSFIILLLLNYCYHWMLFLIVQSTLWVKKKHAILVLGIILANVDRFSFTVGLSNKFAARPTTP